MTAPAQEAISLKATGVYIIANLENGNVYVGSSARSFAARFSLHRSDLRAGKHHSSHLQAAWRKYGEDAFVFAPIEATLPEDAVRVEQIFINAWKPAYNIAQKAGSALGVKRTEETRAKQRLAVSDPEEIDRRRIATQNSWLDPDTKARRIAGIKASHAKPGAKEQRIAILKAAFSRPDVRASRSVAAKEVNARPEVKSRIKEDARARWDNPESAARLVDGMNRPEVKALFSVNVKARYLDQTYREKMLTSHRARGRISMEIAIEIRRMLLAGETGNSIAEKFGISQSAVSKIKLGKLWAQ